MKVYSLMYHDVIRGESNCGFLSPVSDKYKINADLFIDHLSAIKRVRQDGPILVSKDIIKTGDRPPFLLTFDDGGGSAYPYVVDILDKFGWKAHFFVPTDYINSPGFLTTEQVRDISKRGHIVGTHTCSHPERLASLSFNKITEEWVNSIKILSDIIGKPVEIGSVPYGHLNNNVIKAAAASGIKILFTSTPVISVKDYFGGNCMTLGRFTVTRQMHPQKIVGLLSGSLVLRSQQMLFWGLKKMPSLFLGPYHPKLRDLYFSLRGDRTKKGA